MKFFELDNWYKSTELIYTRRLGKFTLFYHAYTEKYTLICPGVCTSKSLSKENMIEHIKANHPELSL